MIDKEFLLRQADAIGIRMDAKQAEAFRLFSSLLTEYNQKVNLTAILDPEEMVMKHFIDSLLLLLCVPLKEEDSLIDVGAGAGFPSVPIGIFHPRLAITQLDASLKRCTFLSYIGKELALNTRAIHMRAEEAGRKEEFREGYDFCTARALAPMIPLAEYCLPFVKTGGCFCAMKGKKGEEEAKEAEETIRRLGGRIAEIKRWELPLAGVRQIVLIKKERKTPEAYPRSSKKIKRDMAKKIEEARWK